MAECLPEQLAAKAAELEQDLTTFQACELEREATTAPGGKKKQGNMGRLLAASAMRQLLSAAALMAVAICPLLQPSAAQAAPATEEEMTLYSHHGPQCLFSRFNGVEFKKAIGIASETLTQTIQGQNGGAIAQLGDDPLPIEDLRKVRSTRF